MPAINSYPARLSVEELRKELAHYAELRRSDGKSDSTVEQDKKVVGYFLRWLESGSHITPDLKGRLTT